MFLRAMIAVIVFTILSCPCLLSESVLDSYLKEGLANNLALKTKRFSLEESLEELKEAKAKFFPSITLQARYTRAGGGRSIDFPVGDLLNPVHNTLNDLLQLHGQPPSFPADLVNETIPLMPAKEQETKISIIQPLFQASIYYNHKIKSNLKNVRAMEVAVFTRQLIADIKKAYFNYLKTVEAVDLYKRMGDVLEENLRVSEKLFKSGKATENVIFNARADIANLEQKKAEAEKNRKLTASYFNFLLNRPLSYPIDLIDEASLSFNEYLCLDEAEMRALRKREEITLFQNILEASKNSLKLAKSAYLPNVSAAFDYGFQGEEYRFTEDNDFWTASIVLQWEIFSGFSRKSNINKASLERKKREAQFQELKEKIRLEVKEAYDDLIIARKSILSAEEGLVSLKKSFEIISKKYEQGMASQIELLNTQTRLTNAEINMLIVKYDYFIKHAQFECVTNRRM